MVRLTYQGGKKMKKILLLSALILTVLATKTVFVQADDLIYPFDSITIVEAFKFDVTLTADPAVDSLLEGFALSGDVLTVYVGTLDFVLDGVPASGSSQVLIVTDDLGNDIARFLINNYSYYEGVSQSWGFASHILIDPAVGVFKDLDMLNLGLKELVIFRDIVAGTYKLVDNMGMECLEVSGTFQSETGLSIVISAYSGGA
jgi:hypothetical protein